MKPEDKTLIKKLIHGDYAVTTIALSLLGLIISATVGLTNVATLTFALSIFTAFDVLGYGAVSESPDRMNLVRYRVIQTVFQWSIFILVGVITNWNLWTCVGYILLWWIGVCDVFFYVLLGKQKDLLSYGHMPWLWWTPIGIFNKYMERNTSGIEVYNIAIWSTIIWYLLPLIFRNLESETLSWFSFILL